MELVCERMIFVSPHRPVSAHCTILWEIVCVKTIRRSGVPILLFISAQGLQNTFALHPYFRQTFEYCRSMHSFPPRMTTLIRSLLSLLVMPNYNVFKTRCKAMQRLVFTNIIHDSSFSVKFFPMPGILSITLSPLSLPASWHKPGTSKATQKTRSRNPALP